MLIHPFDRSRLFLAVKEPAIWRPDLDEFRLGDSPQNINARRPRPFAPMQWNGLPQAREYKHMIINGQEKTFLCYVIGSL